MSAGTTLLTQPFTVPFDAVNYSLLAVNCFSGHLVSESFLRRKEKKSKQTKPNLQFTKRSRISTVESQIQPEQLRPPSPQPHMTQAWVSSPRAL